MDTPVPVPNTEVKHLSGDNSYACHSEDSKSPGNLPSRLTRFFVVLEDIYFSRIELLLNLYY